MREKIFTNCFLIKNDSEGKPEQVCLAMKKRGFGEGLWNGSGGKPNDDETVAQAASREVFEEFGVVVLELEKRAEIDFVLGDEKTVKMHTFVATRWDKEPEESEEMRPKWFNINDVPYDEMWKSDREWLPRILSGEKIKANYTYTCEGGDVTSRQIQKVELF